MTFVSFIFNPGESFKSESDRMLLMLGFASVIFTSAGFISTNWVQTSTAIILSTIMVNFYATKSLKFEELEILPAMIMLVIGGSYTAYHAEFKDKVMFIDKCKNGKGIIDKKSKVF